MNPLFDFLTKYDMLHLMFKKNELSEQILDLCN